MTRRDETVRPGLRATYESVCDHCGHIIAKGDPIAIVRGVWWHRRCAIEGRE